MMVFRHAAIRCFCRRFLLMKMISAFAMLHVDTGPLSPPYFAILQLSRAMPTLERCPQPQTDSAAVPDAQAFADSVMRVIFRIFQMSRRQNTAADFH